MVGGGRDAFIGAVHRKAIALDGQVELVAGALSSSPERPGPRGAICSWPTIATTATGEACSTTN